VTSKQRPAAILALSDGTIFRGYSIGFSGSSTGEVVFNTSLTGYQEILTDPSYAKQIVTLTYPHIGNVGVNTEDEESDSIWCSGLIIKDLPALASNFRSQKHLDDYLVERKVVGIAGIDTRKLTRILRESGAQSGCLVVADASGHIDTDAAINNAKSFSGLEGMDLAREVTIEKPAEWKSGLWSLGQGHVTQSRSDFHVVAYDFGVKRNILRLLVDRPLRMFWRWSLMVFFFPMAQVTLSHATMPLRR